MNSVVATSKEEYLSTTYSPDREWVDGVLVERNVGTQLHALTQRIVATYLSAFRQSHGIEVFTEARLDVGGRYRIPDVMVLRVPYTKSDVTLDVPFIVVEVKSPDDRFDDIMEKCWDYLGIGVPYILVIDPDHRRMYRFSVGSLTSTSSVHVSTTNPVDIEIDIQKIAS